MGRWIGLLVFGLALGSGVTLAWRMTSRAPAPADPAAVLVRVREVARLETLDVAVYKKVSFSPEPTPGSSFWGDVAGWLRHTLAAPRGKAIVFADAHLGLDLEKLGPENVLVRERTVWIVLPPIRVTVEIRPGETEILGSNLDSAETARLLELARVAFEREIAADARIRAQARRASERALRGLLMELGFREVNFPDRLPGTPAA